MRILLSALAVSAVLGSSAFAAGYCEGAVTPSQKMKCCQAHPNSPHCK